MYKPAVCGKTIGFSKKSLLLYVLHNVYITLVTAMFLCQTDTDATIVAPDATSV